MNIKRLVTNDFQENCYVIYDEENNGAIIDPGGDEEIISSFIEKNNIKIKKILLTHGHFDHIGAVDRLSEKYNVKVGINKKEIPVIEKNKDICFYETPVPKNLEFVSQDDIIKIGNMELKVIETPGHTTGSVCYRCENNLFSGDTLFMNSVGRWDFFSGSLDELKESVTKKLFCLPDNTKVYSGHGFSTDIGTEKYSNVILGC